MTPRRGATLGLAATVAWALARRPLLWWEALRQARSAASAPYRGFRAVTAYGDSSQMPAAEEVLRWLVWARSLRRLCSGAQSVNARPRG